MMLFKFILRTCRGMMFLTTLAAVLSGACNAGLIALVTLAITSPKRSESVLMWGFIAMGIGKIASNWFSQVLLASFSQGAIAELRRSLIRKVLGVPLLKLEQLGTPRILVALTDDVFNITQALLGIPLTTVNLAMLLGGAGYLAWLSWKLLLGATVLVVAGGIGYRLVIISAMRFLDRAREEEDRLFGFFRALTEGLKELKLHRLRRTAFVFRDVQETTETFQRLNIGAEVRFISAQSWSHLLYFTLVGLILFLLPAIGPIPQRTLVGYVVTTLYLMGPLAGVMGSFSLLGRANVALQKVEKLGVSLDEQSTEQCAFGEAQAERSFEKLELCGVVHSYHHEQDDSHFTLGPLDASFRPGELVFLVGGNGSGKSTLAKLIAGLYSPEAGEIRLDGRPVTDANRDDYRQLFSAIFADFYLFDNLLGLSRPDLDAQAGQFLEQLHLQHKVQVRNGVLSTTAVSQGQRKRLALLTAYLEDRPFYLFDEWAADQDPQFKNVFYTQLLADLKARGKTVLVVTHDDRFFYLADRILKLDYGKLVGEQEAEEASGGLLAAP